MCRQSGLTGAERSLIEDRQVQEGVESHARENVCVSRERKTQAGGEKLSLRQRVCGRKVRWEVQLDEA
jgi:hypothetical protein